MSAVMKLVQGTAEWHAHRAQFRNASESAAVMGCNPWQSAYQLWCVRTGRLTVPVTAPMQHGSQMEPVARAAYEEKTGLVMQPLVLTEGDYSASLDGITLEGDLILEIKVPYKGQASDLWQSVNVGEVPEHYQIQVQHQLGVSGASSAHLFVFDGKEGILLEVKPDPETWRRIQRAWEEFATCLTNDTPPPLTEKDVRLRADLEWLGAAAAYIAAKQAADDSAAALDAAKAALVVLASHSSESGGGVKVTRFSKVGAVDYKKIPELKGVDLDQFRGKSREEVRVTVG